MRHIGLSEVSEHRINLSFLQLTVFIVPSRIPIRLVRLFPYFVRWQSLRDVSDSNVTDNYLFRKFHYMTQPDPTHGWIRPGP